MKNALAALTLFLSLALSGHAATFGDFTYETANSQVTITGYSGPGGPMTIPDKIDNLPVTSIGNNAFSPNYTGITSLTSVTIPNSVTSIGAAAFYKCTGLTSVTIPDRVTSIAIYAFSGCTGLTSVTIPNSVTSIGEWAFSACTGLTSVTIPDSVTEIERLAFISCTGLTSVTIPNSVTSIGQQVFYNCTGLTSVTIPDSVTSIGHQAFYKCTGLTSLTIPNSVTSIGSSAFEYCGGLKSVTIGSGVTSIGSSVFSGCSGLTSVTIPNSVTSIGSSAFEYCGGLKSVTIGSGVTSIGDQAFQGCSGLTSVTIPNSVTNIGDGAFSSCSGLRTILVDSNNQNFSAANGVLFNKNQTTLIQYSAGKPENAYAIPDSVITIGNWAFHDCSGLTSVTISNSVTSIGDMAFYGCTGLTSVTIPNSVTRIGEWAFSACTGLTSVTIPDSVTEIERLAFISCTGLTSVTIPNSVTSIGQQVFYNCTGLTSVTIPNSVTSIGQQVFYNCTGLTSVTIPNSVTSIGDMAFYGCSGLKIFYFEGDAPKTVGYNQFPEGGVIVYAEGAKGWGTTFCGLKSFIISSEGYGYNVTNNVATISSYLGSGGAVFIPSSINGYRVTSIWDEAFSNCTGLTSVTIPNSVTSIGAAAFSNCTGLTSVTIGSGVTSIGNGAFRECSGLTSVTIPNSVTSIGWYAFMYCSNLTSVTIPSGVDGIEAYAPWGSSAQIIRVDSPVIALQLFSAIIKLGEDTIFSVTATGVNLSYQWQKNGVDIAGATQAALSLGNVKPADAGSYAVVIRNTLNGVVYSVTSSAATLTVVEVPVISSQPSSVTVAAGQSASLSVSATGNGALSYQWQKDGVNVAGGTQAILSLSNVQVADAGSYTVGVSNIINGVVLTSRAATFTVVSTPAISAQPANATVNVGQSASFSISAAGNGTLSYQWKKGGVDIAGATQTILSLGNVQAADVGSYTVVIRNTLNGVVNSATSSAATLTVVEVPVISSQPSSVTVAAGQSTGLSVSATGNGTLSYQWKKDGVNVAGGTQATLNLSNVQVASAGSYTVDVSNIINGVVLTSRVVTLTVISTQPANTTVNVGQSASFSVSAAGNGTLSYQWQKGGVDIAGATQTTLSLGNVQAADAGIYAVVIRNTLNGVVNSASSSAATLTVVVKPTITSQPTSLVLNPGQGASFSVAATGSAASYQWRKNGANIEGATGATLAFKNISASDAASYTVVATNAAGSVTSGAAVLTVNAATYGLLRVADGPQTLVFDTYQYAPVILTVSAADLLEFANPQFRWSKGGNSLVGQTGASLIILDPDATDAGVYSVTVTGDNSKSSTISVTLEAAPVVTPSITLVDQISAVVGQTINIRGQGFTHATAVTINDTAVAFQFINDNLIVARVPMDAAQGLVRVWKGDIASTSGSVLKKNPLLNFAIQAYGSNQYGQTLIPNFGGKSLYGLVSGANHNVALLSNSISIWGSKDNSDIPKASYGNYASVPDEAVIKVSAGSDFTVALQKNGKASAWGENSSGQATVTKDLPTGASVAAGSYHAFLLSTGGMIYGWGDNNYGQMSGGSGLDHVVSVLGADQFSAALRSDGGLYAWGTNLDRQTNTDPKIQRQNVPFLRQKRLMQFSLGKSHALGLRRDGTVVAWGSNVNGQCDVPAGLDHVIALAAGNYHSLALKDDGTVVAWGQIINAVTNVLERCVVPVDKNQRIAGIASGLNHFLLLTDNTKISDLPVMTAAPVNATVNQGESANFRVSATGALTYQWSKAGVKIPGAMGDSLFLTNIQPADAVGYSVTMTNGAGSITSNAATLTVITPPTSILIQPASQIAYLGRTITLTSTVSFSPLGASPVNYQWYKDGVAIHDAAGASLTLTNLLDTHSGNYYVVANNSAGTQKSNDVSLTVTKGTTTITEEPTASPITSGQTLASSSLSGGVASVAGVFAFTALNTAPSVGITWQEYTFTPTDLTNYNTVTGMVSVTVSNLTSKAPTVTTAPVASSITYGQTLASSPLNGGVGSVTGTFAFTKPSTAPNAGTALQGYTFTPTDLINYSPVTGTVSVTVNKATPTITTAPVASAIAYGQTLAASTLSGGVGSVAGAFVFTTPNTAPSDGASFQEYTFTPTESSNYNTVSGTVSVMVSVTVNQFYSRVGEEMQLDLTKFGSSGTMKLVGTLPKGLTFNSKTGILGGKITGKAGNYPLKLQFISGKTVLSSIDLTLTIAAYPSGLVGTFKGLLKANGSGLPVGVVSLTVVAPGTCTASLDLAGSSKVLSAKGSFSLDPSQAAVDLTIPFSAAMMVHLRLDPSSALVSGDYPQGIVEGFRMASGSELPTRSQLFTLTIDQGALDGMTIPAGLGWATGTVSNKGAIALTGQLGDGKALTVATQLSATGQAIIWLKPYSNPNSFVGGIVSLRDRGLVKNGSDAPLTEGLSWYRVADAKEPSYPNGFGPLQADAGIAPYAVPASAAALAMSLGLPTTTFPNVIIDGGGLPDSITASLPTSMTLDNAFKLKAVPNLLSWSGTVNKANGSFSGTLTLPTSASDVLAGPAKVSGVLLGGSYYSPHVGSGLVKIPLKSPKGSFRTAAIVTSSEAP